MNRQLVYWIALGVVLGGALGVSFGKSDWGAPVVMGGLGGLLGLVGGVFVRGIERTLRSKEGVTDYAGLGGALAGAVAGGMVARQSEFGRLMIAVFNPQLPPQDFAAPFGMIGGSVIGAFLGAAVVSGLSRICRRKVPPRGEHGDHAAGSDS
ncbi:MAG: hypothetical protein CMJ75_20725 [Planctomycetaceae bacterium]|nr:hypothetical protein [Planctomycetaceae bacterium]